MPTTVSHPITDIRGIGPATAAELQSYGLRFAEDLLSRPPEFLAQDLSPVDGLTFENLLGRYIPNAMLLRLDGITLDQAADLAAAAFNYDRLTFTPTEQIVSLLEREGHPATEEQVLRFQLAAAARRSLVAMMIRVVDTDDVPQPEAIVHVVDPPGSGVAADWQFQTNEAGRVLIDVLRPGPQLLLALHNEMSGQIATAVDADSRAAIIVLSTPAPGGVTYDEAVSGPVLMASPGARPAITFDEVADGTLLELSAIGEDDIRLTVFFRQRIGLTWRFQSTRVPAALRPEEAELGALLARAGDGLSLVAASAADHRLELYLQNNPPLTA